MNTPNLTQLLTSPTPAPQPARADAAADNPGTFGEAMAQASAAQAGAEAQGKTSPATRRERHADVPGDGSGAPPKGVKSEAAQAPGAAQAAEEAAAGEPSAEPAVTLVDSAATAQLTDVLFSLAPAAPEEPTQGAAPKPDEAEPPASIAGPQVVVPAPDAHTGSDAAPSIVAEARVEHEAAAPKAATAVRPHTPVAAAAAVPIEGGANGVLPEAAPPAVATAARNNSPQAGEFTAEARRARPAPVAPTAAAPPLPSPTVDPAKLPAVEREAVRMLSAEPRLIEPPTPAAATAPRAEAALQALATAQPPSPVTSSIAAHSTIGTPVGQPGFAQDFGQRVVMLAAGQVKSAELSLHPAELGPVRVSIEMRGQEASLTFVAGAAATRSAIEEALPRLREMFAAQGLNLAEASIGGHAGHGGHDTYARPQQRRFDDGAEGGTDIQALPRVLSGARPVRLIDVIA